MFIGAARSSALLDPCSRTALCLVGIVLNVPGEGHQARGAVQQSCFSVQLASRGRCRWQSGRCGSRELLLRCRTSSLCINALWFLVRITAWTV